MGSCKTPGHPPLMITPTSAASCSLCISVCGCGHHSTLSGVRVYCRSRRGMEAPDITSNIAEEIEHETFRAWPAGWCQSRVNRQKIIEYFNVSWLTDRNRRGCYWVDCLRAGIRTRKIGFLITRILRHVLRFRREVAISHSFGLTMSKGRGSTASVDGTCGMARVDDRFANPPPGRRQGI